MSWDHSIQRYTGIPHTVQLSTLDGEGAGGGEREIERERERER